MRIVVIIALAVVLAGCTLVPAALQPTPTPACQAEVSAYLDKMRPLVGKFSDTTKLANSTARIALAPIVRDMQQIRRDMIDIPSPQCAKPAVLLISEGTDLIVNNYIRFIAKEDEKSIAHDMAMGADKFTDGMAQLTALAAGAKETPTPAWAFK